MHPDSEISHNSSQPNNNIATPKVVISLPKKEAISLPKKEAYTLDQKDLIQTEISPLTFNQSNNFTKTRSHSTISIPPTYHLPSTSSTGYF